MAAQAPIVMKHLPRSPWVYETASCDLNFYFPNITNVEPEAEYGWRAIDTPGRMQFCFAALASTVIITGTEQVATDNASRAALAEIDSVVDAIRNTSQLAHTTELDDLLTQALQTQGRPQNVLEWARHLADSVGRFTD